MKEHLIIDGNSVYEIDECCMQQMKKEQKGKRNDNEIQNESQNKRKRKQGRYR